jgi:hypothetical protein
VARATQKEAALGIRNEEQRRRREEQEHETEELAALNAQWRDL